jgi:hypothetical protein
MSLDAAIAGLPLPLHPGAIRYYEEAGDEIPIAFARICKDIEMTWRESAAGHSPCIQPGHPCSRGRTRFF